MDKQMSTNLQQESNMESDSNMWCCRQDFCCCCCSLLGLSQSILNRFKYVLILSIGTGLCFLAISLSNLRRKVHTIQVFCNTTVSTTTCDKLFGYFAVYRLCFSLCVFHFMMSLVLIGVKSTQQPRRIFHSGFWPLKCLALICMATGTFFIPNWSYFYKVLMDLGMAGSFIFAIIQVLLLTDFAQHWYSDTQNKETEGNNKCQNFVLFTSAFVMYIVSFVLATVLYLSYGSQKACKTNRYFIIFNGCQCLVASLISVLPAVQKAQANSGFLKSATVTTFTVFSTWLALSHGPYSTCNLRLNSSFSELNGPNNLSIQAISSSLLTILVLIYEAISSGLPKSKSKIWPFAHDKKDQSKDNDSNDVVTYNFSFFHFVMLLSSTHVMISLTNWYVPQSIDFKPSWTAVLVKMISSAASVWVYVWTLIAPVMRSTFYSFTDDESSIYPDSKREGKFKKSQESAAEIRDQMNTVPSNLNHIQKNDQEATDLKNIPMQTISNNNDSVKVSHGSMSRRSSLRSLSPKSDTEKEMLRLQNKVITLQEKIAKLQTKVATLQGLNI